MTPTPEQIAAAKDELRNQCEPKDHHLVGDLIHFVRDQNKASNILLAALESAEAKVDAMASRESASVAKEIETSADMLAQVQNAEARVKELEERLKGTLQAGGYQYFCEQLHAAEREACNARYVAEQLKKKLEASEADGARLDWLNRQSDIVYYDGTHGTVWNIGVEGEDRTLCVRTAIDQAMKKDAARKEDRT